MKRFWLLMLSSSIMVGTLYLNAWMMFSDHGLAFHLHHGTPGSRLAWLFIGLLTIGFEMGTVTALLFIFGNGKE